MAVKPAQQTICGYHRPPTSSPIIATSDLSIQLIDRGPRRRPHLLGRTVAALAYTGTRDSRAGSRFWTAGPLICRAPALPHKGFRTHTNQEQSPMKVAIGSFVVFIAAYVTAV